MIVSFCASKYCIRHTWNTNAAAMCKSLRTSPGVIGRILGVTGVCILDFSQRSLKLKKSSTSKMNCVIASQAPTSILRLSYSTSFSRLCPSECFMQIVRHVDIEISNLCRVIGHITTVFKTPWDEA